jgi:hypothetical protein
VAGGHLHLYKHSVLTCSLGVGLENISGTRPCGTRKNKILIAAASLHVSTHCKTRTWRGFSVFTGHSTPTKASLRAIGTSFLPRGPKLVQGMD